MEIKFTKMHGCGNDYVYINGFTEHIDADKKPEFIRQVSHRHFGIGSDGVIFINPSDVADFEMEMWNADGTRAEMCGNGIRCVGKYVYDYGLTDKTEIDVVSFGAVKKLKLFVKGGKVEKVRVNMGKPILKPADIPVKMGDLDEKVVNQSLWVAGKEYFVTCVSMGNPHAVTFIERCDDLDIEAIGPLFENHEAFPKRINTEFVQIVDKEHVKMRVWERGTGETFACGTGCCATAVACFLNKKCGRSVEVEVLGGKINIEWDEKTDEIFMTGPATTVFDGVINY